MLTSDNTYHGYRKMSLPDGITRKSTVKRSLAKHWTGLAATREKVFRHR